MPSRGQPWKEGGLNDSTVTSADIKDGEVKAVDMAIFVSSEQTGNGSAQNVAHGLGIAPSKVLIAPTEFGASVAVDIAEGTHTATNVVCTVSNGVKYKVLAFA
jgi:hypothetical protein|tara:strand:+ start:733 stop:1041 length:309 start_codon:yes stop_codon:yes gene_type:complete